MPPVTSKSGLFAKYGGALDKAVQAHAADETNYGPVRLPGGIRNGIAKLVDCKFDVFKTGPNTGQYFFRAAGVVVEPDDVTTASGSKVPVRGLQTSILIPCCATKNRSGKVTTQEDNVSEILNEMRKLGGDDYTKGAKGSSLESLAAGLAAASPYFRFSTSQSAPTPEFPDPRVWENWHGSKGLEDYEPPTGDGVEEETAGAAPASEETEEEAPADGPFNEFDDGSGDEKEGEEEGEDDGADDLDALASAADDDQDKGAMTKLKALAKKAGVSDQEIDDADSWASLAEMVRSAQEAPAPKAKKKAEEKSPPAPKLKEVWLYLPPGKNPATKAPYKDPIEGQVTKVNAAKKTVTLKDLDNGKEYADVPFDALKTS